MNWHLSSARCHTRVRDNFLESAKVSVFINVYTVIILTTGSSLLSVTNAFLYKNETKFRRKGSAKDNMVLYLWSLQYIVKGHAQSAHINFKSQKFPNIKLYQL